jgi:hypothetical protein
METDLEDAMDALMEYMNEQVEKCRKLLRHCLELLSSYKKTPESYIIAFDRTNENVKNVIQT